MCKFAHGLGELKEVPVDSVNRRLRKMLSSMAVEWLDVSRIRFVTFKREIHVFSSPRTKCFSYLPYISLKPIPGGCRKLQSGMKWCSTLTETMEAADSFCQKNRINPRQMAEAEWLVICCETQQGVLESRVRPDPIMWWLPEHSLRVM